MNEMEEIREEKNAVEHKAIEIDKRNSKIQKQNKLAEDMNSKFYGMSKKKLGKEINSQLTSLVLNLKSGYLE
jgi:hypothetical protein